MFFLNLSSIISGGLSTDESPHNKMRCNMEYRVANLLNGMVTIVVANSVLDAMKKGQKYFTEPNRSVAKVQVIN